MRGKPLNDETVAKRLLVDYPDRVIRDNLTSLPFYSSINNTAHSLKVKPVALLRALGFRIQKERRSTVC